MIFIVIYHCDLHGFIYIIHIHFQYGKLTIIIDKQTQMSCDAIMEELKQYSMRYFIDASFNCMKYDLCIGSKYVISKHYCDFFIIF